MGIEKTPFFSLVCDQCGAALTEPEHGYTVLYDSRREALADAVVYGMVFDGKIFCEACKPIIA